VVNAATREKDLAWITEQAKAFDVQVTERPDFGMIAVQGPHAREKVLGLLREEDRAAIAKLGKFAPARRKTTEGVDVFVARTGYTGEDGFEVVVPEAQTVAFWNELLQARREAGGPGRTRHAAPGSRHGALRPGHGRHRLAVRSRAGVDRGARRGPRLHRRGVLEAQKAAGVPRQMIGLVMDEKGVLRHGQKVLTDNGEGENPFRHVLADAGQGDRLRPRAGRSRRATCASTSEARKCRCAWSSSRSCAMASRRKACWAEHSPLTHEAGESRLHALGLADPVHWHDPCVRG
jgi:hypothetical protein